MQLSNGDELQQVGACFKGSGFLSPSNSPAIGPADVWVFAGEILPGRNGSACVVLQARLRIMRRELSVMGSLKGFRRDRTCSVQMECPEIFSSQVLAGSLEPDTDCKC